MAVFGISLDRPPRNPKVRTFCGSHEELTAKRLVILIPLLREQSTLPSLFLRAREMLESVVGSDVVFVTTERETLEAPGRGENIPSTMEVLAGLLRSTPSIRHRVHHCHYPRFNRVVAEQLNFALDFLPVFHQHSRDDIFVLTLNADSVVCGAQIKSLFDRLRNGDSILQQSSLFLSNVPDLLKRHRTLPACFGLYQSCWTLQHELPRYLACTRFVPFLPSWVESHHLVHCVTHGLAIRLDILMDAGGFPVCEIGGEDLALGFILKSKGYHIDPVPTLENAETPDSVRKALIQSASWFPRHCRIFLVLEIISSFNWAEIEWYSPNNIFA